MVEAPPELPVDTDYLDLGLEGAGPVELSRPSGPTPLRWAYHDADGATVASGNSWTAPGTTADVIVQPGAPIDPLPSWRWTPRPAAGRGRVVMVIPDCMDWRIVQYLRTRGELPVMDELIARGRRAVVWSEPAYTAAAMNSLTHPAGRDRASVLEALAELGSELRERSTTATNPVAWMESILPTATDVFDHLGGADHVVTNLLYGHGVIDSARQGTVVGPYGEVNPPVRSDTYRPITDDEFAAVRGLEEAARGKEPRLFTESAALMDLTVELAIQGRSDLVMVRIGPLDILTHGDFSTLSDGRQDDGVSDLLALYRYMDLRIGQVAEQLDGNDTLIVASDHGIRTAMEHDERAVFVVVGPGIEPGRVAGHPDWRGVPALIARLLGEDVDWPRGGLELEPQAD